MTHTNADVCGLRLWWLGQEASGCELGDNISGFKSRELLPQKIRFSGLFFFKTTFFRFMIGGADWS